MSNDNTETDLFEYVREVTGKKWGFNVISSINDSEKRFKDLKDEIDGSSSTLTKRLEEQKHFGLIQETEEGYSPTEQGEKFQEEVVEPLEELDKHLEPNSEEDQDQEDYLGHSRKILGRKGIPAILYYLKQYTETEDLPEREGNMRYGEIKEKANIVDSTLSEVLDILEDNNMVKREQLDEIPPHTEYEVTELGRNYAEIVETVEDFYWEFEASRFSEDDCS